MNEIDVRLVKAFVAVADERSFTQAASRLRVAQPWLSVQIRKLEDRLGYRLFERNRNRAVELTACAEALLPKARDLLIASERFAADARQIRAENRTRLRLGAPDFTAEMPIRAAIVDGFAAQNPAIQMEVSNAWTVDLLQSLRDGRLDVAITVGPHVDPALEAVVVARHRFAFLVQARDFPEAPPSLPLAAFAGSAVAVFRRSVNAPFHDSVVPRIEAAGISVTHLTESGAIATIHAAEHSGGMALIADYIPARMLPRSLLKIDIEDAELCFALNVVRRAEDRNAAVGAFWRHARSIAKF